LTEAAALFSTHLWEVPAQARKSLDEIKMAQKAQHQLLEEVAELQAQDMLQTAAVHASGYKLVSQFFPQRDLNFIKMLAQKIARSGSAVALLSCGGRQPSLVFGQTAGLSNDMGTLMKETVQQLGTRGGGARDMAQGGAPDAAGAEQALNYAASRVG
jgi:alanyl-tRNA synthetase